MMRRTSIYSFTDGRLLPISLTAQTCTHVASTGNHQSTPLRALNWKQIKTTTLSKTNQTSERFVRASFYINAISKNDTLKKALASVFNTIFRVDFNKINFGDRVKRKRDLSKNQENIYAGDATTQLNISPPFHFPGIDKEHKVENIN